MKHFIAVLTYYDSNDCLRSTPMTFKAKGKNAATVICKQQASTKYGLAEDDIVDIHIVPNGK